MPMLSVRVWKALHQRLAGNDQHNMWFTDAFWDFVAFAGKGSCKTTGPLLVEASPASFRRFHRGHWTMTLHGKLVGGSLSWLNCGDWFQVALVA